MGKYLFNLETTKIELHFQPSEYKALSEEDKKSLKSAFLWSSYGKCWVSRAKEPNLWRAKEVAKHLGFTEEERIGERLSFAEQVERQTERAEERAERYEQYAENAERNAARLQNPIEDMRGDIAFFTQPNINSTSGRAFTSRREKMFERYDRGFKEYRKSDYFRNKAAAAIGTASKARFDNPVYLDRRIKDCKKEIRARERNIINYEQTLYAIENGEEKTRLGGEPISAQEVSAWIDEELELLEKAMDKQAYLENCLDEVGGIKFSKGNIKTGYVVSIKGYGQCEVLSTGAVNVKYKILTGGAAGMTLRAAYAEITEILKAEEKKAETHPFCVGDTFKAVVYDEQKDNNTIRFVKRVVEYEIIKASNSTITLKAVGTDEKPITRKPKKAYNGCWKFSIDRNYDNTFYKRAGIAYDEEIKKDAS